jgi:hypothetical protein
MEALGRTCVGSANPLEDTLLLGKEDSDAATKHSSLKRSIGKFRRRFWQLRLTMKISILQN